MKILHAAALPIPSTSGAFSRFHSIARPLKDRAEGYTILSLVANSRRFSREPRLWDGFPVYEVGVDGLSINHPGESIATLWTLLKRLSRIVKDQEIDTVILHGLDMELVASSLINKEFNGIRILVDHMDVPGAGHIRPKWAFAAEKAMFRHADLIIAISRNIVSRARKAGARNVLYLPPLVDTKTFAPSPPRGSLTDKLGLRYNPVVIFSGYWWEIKGIDLLLEAASSLRQSNRTFSLLLVGGNHEERAVYLDKLRSLELADCACLTGPVPRESMPDMINLADIAVAPFKRNDVNEHAGPSKISEYLACGKPVIATDVGDLPVLVHNGVTGMIVEPNAHALARTLGLLLEDRELCRSLGVHAREFAVRNLDMWRRAPEILTALRAPSAFGCPIHE